VKTYLRAAVAAAMLAIFSLSIAADAAVEFNSRAKVLKQKLDAGTMTELGFAREMASLTAELFPTDYKLQDLRDYKVLLASRLERGEIDRDEYDYLWSQKTSAFLAERERDNDEYQAAQASRQETESRESVNQTVAAGVVAQGADNAFGNTAPAPDVRCTTNVPAGTALANCN
jgi:hypothetical protein